MVDQGDVVTADGGFIDFMFDIERKALEDLGDEEALAIHEADRRAAQEAYERELNEDGMTGDDVE